MKSVNKLKDFGKTGQFLAQISILSNLQDALYFGKEISEETLAHTYTDPKSAGSVSQGSI